MNSPFSKLNIIPVTVGGVAMSSAVIYQPDSVHTTTFYWTTI
jgi:hypothetical protein